MEGLARVIRFLEAPFPPGGVEWRLNDRLDKVGAQATAPASSSHPAPSAQPASAQTEQEDLRASLENAQKAIGELIDQLKARNLGGQATKVLIKHRWMRDHTPPDPTPADLQRATAVYKELKALLQGGEAG